MHNFRELKVWHKSRNLVKEVYQITKSFSKEEVFGLSIQARRSAVSIPSNISEGCGRGTDAQLNRFLDIAQGSACGLETQMILSFDLGYITESELNEIVLKINEVQKMIRGFQNSLDI